MTIQINENSVFVDKKEYILKITEDNKTSTNSSLGSNHWFNTIAGRHKRIGEFLKEKTPNEETLRLWGKELYETSQELMNGFDYINKNFKQ